jgi:hypothetical protein
VLFYVGFSPIPLNVRIKINYSYPVMHFKSWTRISKLVPCNGFFKKKRRTWTEGRPGRLQKLAFRDLFLDLRTSSYLTTKVETKTLGRELNGMQNSKMRRKSFSTVLCIG